MSSDETPQPPPYEETETTKEELSTHTNSQAEVEKREDSNRLKEINQRLNELGYNAYDPPISCHAYLMSYQAAMNSWRSTKVDAAEYAKKLGTYVSEYTRSKDVLDSKIKELVEKNIDPGDVADFTFKEERDGRVYKNTIGTYYETHRKALSNLVKLIENSTPVDGRKLFEEKNRLVEEKIGLLLKMRRLQLLEFEGIMSTS